MEYRECVITGCDNYVSPENEAIHIGVQSSSETPICSDCYSSEDDNVINQIAKIRAEAKELPF